MCRSKYNVLDGQGAEKYGGRWNSPGHRMVYLSNDPALCVLEILVNLDLPIDLLPTDYELVCIELSFKKNVNADKVVQQQENPKLDINQSQHIGDNWLRSKKSLVLTVPSVIVPESQNILLNPTHELMECVQIKSKRQFEFDGRLFSNKSN